MTRWRWPRWHRASSRTCVTCMMRKLCPRCLRHTWSTRTCGVHRAGARKPAWWSCRATSRSRFV